MPITEKKLTAKLNLNWDDRKKDKVFVNVENPYDLALKIDGVQTSANLYVVDFSKNIPARKTGVIELVYDTQANSDSSLDLIRIKSNLGIQVIEVIPEREKIVSFSSRTLSWTVGDPVTPKFVELELAAESGVIPKLRKVSRAHTAILEDLGGSRYKIIVTPRSTAKPEDFSVFVDFTPDVPGVASVILCQVKAKE